MKYPVLLGTVEHPRTQTSLSLLALHTGRQQGDLFPPTQFLPAAFMTHTSPEPKALILVLGHLHGPWMGETREVLAFHPFLLARKVLCPGRGKQKAEVLLQSISPWHGVTHGEHAKVNSWLLSHKLC